MLEAFSTMANQIVADQIERQKPLLYRAGARSLRQAVKLRTVL